MTEFVSPLRWQPVDGNGDVFAGAKAYFYDVGTTNQRTVYTDAAKSTPHTQPILADADGRFPAVYLPDGDFKRVLHDANDVLILSDDNVPGPVAAAAVTSTYRTPTETLNQTTVLDATAFGKLYAVDPTGGDFSVFLPTAVDNDSEKIEFIHTGTAGIVTLDGTSTQTINDAQTLELKSKENFAQVTANGANYVAMASKKGANSVDIEALDSTVTGYFKPVGEISIWMHPTIPAGYLECDGASLTRGDYPELFAAIGTRYGFTDDSHFNLPNFRSMFLRGYTNGRADIWTDPDVTSRLEDGTTGASTGTGDNIGTYQADQVAAHSHPSSFGAVVLGADGGGQGSLGNFSGNTGLSGGNESRSNNISVMFIIFASPSAATGNASSLNQVRTGTGTPSASLGIDGDYYIQTDVFPYLLFGPKTASAWSAGVNMGIDWRGAWATTTDYKANDAVSRAGQSYICKQVHTAAATSEPGTGATWSTYWDVMSERGLPGVAGPTLGISWNFSTTTTAADPGPGLFRLNHATPSSATALYIDDEDTNAVDVSSIVNHYMTGTSTNKAQILLIDPSATTTHYNIFDVTGGTDNSGFSTLSITHVAGTNTMPADGSEIVIQFLKTGNKGDDGADGSVGNVDPWVGGTARPIVNVLRDNVMPSIIDFGGVGDGTTDDLAAMNLALAQTRGVYLPWAKEDGTQATWYFNGTVNVGTDKFIIGDPYRRTKVKQGAARLFSMAGTDMGFENLEIDASAATTTAHETFYYDTTTAGVDQVRFNNLLITSPVRAFGDANSTGLVANNHISDVSIVRARGVSIVAYDWFAFNFLYKVTISNVGLTPAPNYGNIYINGAAGLDMEHCEINYGGTGSDLISTSYGIYLDTCSAVRMERCFGDTVGGHGILISGCNGVEMDNCKGNFCGSHQIGFYNSNHVVSDNIYAGGRVGFAGGLANSCGLYIENCPGLMSHKGRYINNFYDGVYALNSSTHDVRGWFRSNGRYGYEDAGTSAYNFTGGVYGLNTSGNIYRISATSAVTDAFLASGALVDSNQAAGAL